MISVIVTVIVTVIVIVIVGFLEEVDLTLPQWRRRVLEKATASLVLAMWMADDIGTDETTMVRFRTASSSTKMDGYC